ncbi:MAG: glucose/quinate/shikimate family membrane-bound PQQ-dependent dehydrogenase [Bryobacter sp.]
MRTFLLFLCASLAVAQSWSEYGGGVEGAQYSPLTQINKENVGQLQVAWKYQIGDGKKYFFNPLQVGADLYVMGANNSLVCLQAASGKVRWTYVPPADTKVITSRGINYWQSKNGRERRLFFVANHTLRALDAATGKLVEGFAIDLKLGLDRDPATIQLVQSTTPGRVFEDLLILGSATNQGYGSAPGDIRAFDVRSGKLRWTFHTVPRPGEYGYDTWPKDAWKTVGGANVWGEMSVDPARGILYAPTASAKYNFWGGDRTGENLFADCLLALDARTGNRLWHYQFIHHDILDYDGASSPKLLTVRRGGKQIDAVALATKQGYLFVFDRVNGKPVFPIEERPAPASDVPGEKTAPTQPHSTLPPFSRQRFTVDDLSPYLSAADRAKFRDQILSARNDGLFTPPSLGGSIQMPGNNGGSNWGGVSVDAARGRLVVVSKDLPCLLKLDDKDPAEGATRYETPFGFMLASDGLAAIKPPWTTITMYDLNEGKILWQQPLGEVPFLAAKGIKNTGTHYPKVGPVLTASGLVFTGTRDKKVRAFDADTGKLLWEYTLEAAMEGIPAVYEINGRQYVVFCASAQAGLTPATFEEIKGAYVAFALPGRE